MTGRAADACGPAGGGARCGVPICAALPLVLRLTLGALFIISGLMKLNLVGLSWIHPSLVALEPRDFAFSIRAFKLGLSDPLVQFLTFAIPWTELLCGLALILGLLTRGAAAIIALLMLAFIAGIASLLSRGLDVNCPCFGALKLFCTGPLGVCHIVRNLGFAAAAGVLLWLGPGPCGLDRLLERRAT